MQELIGEIIETVSNNACNTKLVIDPVVGASTDMCAVLDIAQDVIGGFWYITGLETDALVNAVPGTTLPMSMGSADGTTRNKMILPVGGIDLNLANSNPTTGSVTWFMRYAPMYQNARVIGSCLMIIKNRPYVLFASTVVNQAFTNVSAAVVLPVTVTGTDTIRIAVTKDCYFLLGDSTVVVSSATGVWLPAGVEYLAIDHRKHTHIAFIRDTISGNANIVAAK